MDGLELTRCLRRPEMAHPAMPVLILTARDALHDRVQGLDLGADDYMVKPYELPELLARLRALLRRGTQARPVVLACGDVELDPAEKRVLVAGAEATLTTREFALLEYLIRRPGEVVSKTELLDHVWDAALDTAPNAVEVYIGYLRRKIGRERLETVRGSGYRLVAAETAAPDKTEAGR
jgi:DNA-binding response OmpR family regulator